MVWLVSAVLVEAAVIDGLKLQGAELADVPLRPRRADLRRLDRRRAGPALVARRGGAGAGACCLPLYAIGGMGAGDVKLLAGVGAWVGPALTLGAFVASAVVGGVMAVAMVAWSGEYVRHWAMFQTIGHEILTVRRPVEARRETAAARKPTMMLLPYGIPLAVGSIAYFAWAGLLF